MEYMEYLIVLMEAISIGAAIGFICAIIYVIFFKTKKVTVVRYRVEKGGNMEVFPNLKQVSQKYGISYSKLRCMDFPTKINGYTLTKESAPKNE